MKVLTEQIPIIFLPSVRKMIVKTFRKPNMVEDQQRSSPLRFKLEPCDGINASRPIRYAPSLNNALIWYQLNVLTNYVLFEYGEDTSNGRINFCGSSGKFTELF